MNIVLLLILLFSSVFLWITYQRSAKRVPREQVLTDSKPHSSPSTQINPSLNNTHVVSKDFMERIKSVIKSKKDIVFIGRFYSEHNLSFAKTTRLQGNQSSLKTILSLSDDGQQITGPSAAGVYSVAWIRDWYKENYLVPKPGYASNFVELSKQITKLKGYVASQGGSVAAVRYHTYTSHCKFIKDLGNASVLPVPVMLTFKLNPEVGHYSSDTPGKTCIRKASYDSESNHCRELMDLKAYLRRCRQRVEGLLEAMDHAKILMLVTNQQQSLSHPKLLSLPYGVSPNVAAKIALLLSELGAAADRPALVAISNVRGHYSNKVIEYFSRIFHISASLDYNNHNKVEETSVYDYLEKLSLSKFVLCPPGEQGYDSQRIWEALLLGSIPVVERSINGSGLERSFSRLPVLVVPDLLQLQPSHLEKAYHCFTSHAADWRFDQLTQKYWDELLLQTLKTARVEHIQEAHPFRNPYCDFSQFLRTGRWS